MIPKVVGFLLMKLTSIEIRFGSIALSKARNIQILYKGFEVQIEEIALKSNFFNSDISNPVQIFIRDVRINKNIESNDEALVRKTSKLSSNEPIKQIPSYLVTFFQVCRVDILSSTSNKRNLFLVHGYQCIKHFVHLAEQCKRSRLVAAHVTQRV